jgi:hypothetical protein
MARRFRFPAIPRRRISLGLSVAVLALAAAYLLDRPTCCAPAPIAAPDAAALQRFRNTCVNQARHANGGGDLVMDDETEARIGAYCGCVADGIAAKISPLEILKIGEGTAGIDTTLTVNAIVADCRPKLQQPN